MRVTSEIDMRSRYTSDREELFFDKDDGLIGQEGELLCPVCRCCTLELATVIPRSVFAQADIELGLKKSELRFVCSGGCVRTQIHDRRKRA